MPDETLALRNRPIFRILGGVLVLILLVVVVIAVMGRTPASNSDQTNQNQNATSSQPVFDARQGSISPDADQDGLTDSQEAELKTNPALADTDRDDLTDFDEVNVYRSDPLKADTDGDGNNDGLEVSKNFSPTGAGQLYDTSSQVITNATP